MPETGADERVEETSDAADVEPGPAYEADVIDIRDHRALQLPEPRLLNKWQTVAKRSFDLAVSTSLLLLLSPLLLLIALAIRLSSEGPIFYAQERCGLGGRSFRMLKFRSMVNDADRRLDEMAHLAQEGALEVVDAPAFKSPQDPRITKIGALLRRTNFDELPQLINVIRAEMSLVGPRPLVWAEVDWLPPGVAKLRHSVRPGLTCIWQVRRTAATSFEERMAFDLEYVRKQSVAFDLKLIASTPVAVLRGEGSH